MRRLGRRGRGLCLGLGDVERPLAYLTVLGIIKLLSMCMCVVVCTVVYECMCKLLEEEQSLCKHGMTIYLCRAFENVCGADLFMWTSHAP